MPGTIGTPTGPAWAGGNPDRDEECILRAYVQLAVTRWEAPGLRTVTVSRCGTLEVRLTEIPEEQKRPDTPWLWLELYSPAKHLVIDSCGCTEFDEPELARAVELIANARQRTQEIQQEDAASPGGAREFLPDGSCHRSHAQPRNPAGRSRAHRHER